MSQNPRNFHAGGIYHITHRGHNRIHIFEDDFEKAIFLDTLKKVLQANSGNLLYYIVMDNHYHLLFEMKTTPVNWIMQRLNTSYGRHYAHAHHTSGAVFGNRYSVEEVTEPEYFQNIIKYIALNPVRAGLVSKISDYRWSAHLDLIQRKEGIVDSRRLFEILGKTPERGRDIYQDLIQSAQKKTEVLPRQKMLRASRKQKILQAQLDTLLISTGTGIGSEQIQSDKRTSNIVQLRRDFACQAYKQGYSINDIAAVLKVSPRSVRNWCLNSDESKSQVQSDESIGIGKNTR